jgi:hypothetical protein
MADGRWLMTDAKNGAGILDQDARAPILLICHQSSGIKHFRQVTESETRVVRTRLAISPDR